MPVLSPPPACTIRAHPNIALVKYWGKRAGPGNLPAVASLSVTLDALWTETTISVGTTSAAQAGDEVTGLLPEAAARARAFIAAMRERARGEGLTASIERSVHVATHNNFPTAAGLASSASGFAALVCALDEAWGWQQTPTRLSALAREGSGSAARSLFGGFARMHLAGPDGDGAVAEPVLEADAWPLRVLVAIVDGRAKEVGSTLGMQQTQRTSPYWAAWVDSHENDMREALAAIEARDFLRLAEVTEASCLKMHASMLAARPGLVYWQPATVALMHAVRALRRRGVAAAFTIDAGPQVKLVCEAHHEAEVTQALVGIEGVEQLLSSGLGPAPQRTRRQP